jgi:hypothetical protein
MKINTIVFCLIAILGGNLFDQSNEIEEIIKTAFKTEKNSTRGSSRCISHQCR